MTSNQTPSATQNPCWCEACDLAQGELLGRTRMSVCPQCGDKRCPRAKTHDAVCCAVQGVPPVDVSRVALPVLTVGELHQQLQALVDQGLSQIPVCATDLRARYPFTAYTVLTQAGYTDALLLNVRPDAMFQERQPLPLNWAADRIQQWNAESARVLKGGGVFHEANRFAQEK